ncbi:hypothetical protein VULLAG_LOCUS14734 [Vulpes lagopus]
MSRRAGRGRPHHVTTASFVCVVAAGVLLWVLWGARWGAGAGVRVSGIDVGGGARRRPARCVAPGVFGRPRGPGIPCSDVVLGRPSCPPSPRMQDASQWKCDLFTVPSALKDCPQMGSRVWLQGGPLSAVVISPQCQDGSI